MPLVAGRRLKVRAGVAARAGVLDRLAAAARSRRDLTRPLLWLHATSVGEGRQAEAVLRVLRAAHPDWQFAFTFFSPSAAELAGELGVEIADCLPWDRRPDVDTALDLLRPTGLVFAKLDLWPELATRAAARGVAVGLIAATVSPRARRLRWPARRVLAPGYRAVRLAGAITRGDGARLTRLGVLGERIEVTGDPRYDSVLERARAVAPDHPLRRYARGAPTLVAGSTWPGDEAVLLPAYASVRRLWPAARLIVVPHEPTPEHLAQLDQAARRAGLPNPERLTGAPAPHATPFLVVDRVGVLPVFYADAAIGYVGGGFGTRGLHSVIEPAAAALIRGTRLEVLGEGAVTVRLAREAAGARVDAENVRLRAALFSSVTHDLRTPLASLQGHLETLHYKGERLSEAEKRGYMEIALRQSGLLSELVAKLFELAKLDAERPPMLPEPFVLPDLVQDVVQQFELAAANRRVTLAAHLPLEMPLVFGDIGLIERALRNLIENSLRFTPEGGAVRVGVAAEAGHAAVRVSDTGCGIDAADLPRIFDRFYRGEKSRSDSSGNAGLGLAITKRILELHGSAISVASRPGDTTIAFTLPYVSVAVPAGVPAAGSRTGEPVVAAGELPRAAAG